MIQIDMEIPENCYDCRFIVYGPKNTTYADFCCVNGRRSVSYMQRPLWCPLQPVDEDDRK